jgi:benzoyl-CoA reductase/2-hydroxyglutaryl-CoA dehydratase subunit BcrC/BadD/HgdB
MGSRLGAKAILNERENVMGKPFEKTMEVVDGILKPGLQMLEESESQFAPLNAAMLRARIQHFEDLTAALTDTSKKVALFEFGLTPQMFYAFDCEPLLLESYPGMFSASRKDVLHEFLAMAEEAGAPSDVCSTDRFILGAALAGELPSENSFFVTGSSPCDGTRVVYPIMEKVLEIPSLYIESPYTYGKDAAHYYGRQIKAELIPFLEEMTGKKFDIDRFREVIEESNKAYELMVDIFETHKLSPCPHPPGLRLLPSGGFTSQAGLPRLTEVLKAVHEDATRRVREGIKSPVEEKSRVMWAHVPPGFDGTLFGWMQKELGASVVTTSLSSLATLLPIDTTDLDTMLEGYAWQGLDMTMSFMRKDTVESWNTTMKAFDDYNCDALIVTIHVGCNSIAGAAGLWRKFAREKRIPVLFLEFDYNDDRVLSSEPLREQLEEFFTTVAA